MRLRKATLAALAATAAALALALVFGSTESTKRAEAEEAPPPGQPSIKIVAPRNGARMTNHAVVVSVAIDNFQLAPSQFGSEPQLGQGNLRYSLKRVPDCVDPVKLQRAIDSPIGNGRLLGASVDFPEHAGPNGVLAERIGTAGLYSPGTRPTIFYHHLHPGFYRVVVNLAQNNGVNTPYHAVSNFQVLSRPGKGPGPCEDGKVSSANAAAEFR